jgi:hypothetical protein
MTNKKSNEKSVRIEIIGSEELNDMSSDQKINYIIECVKKGSTVLLESGISPDEQALLIEETMMQIDQDRFKGLDIETCDKNSGTDRSLIDRIFNRSSGQKDLMIIGAANKIKTIHSDENRISTILNFYS